MTPFFSLMGLKHSRGIALASMASGTSPGAEGRSIQGAPWEVVLALRLHVAYSCHKDRVVGTHLQLAGAFHMQILLY